MQDSLNNYVFIKSTGTVISQQKLKKEGPFFAFFCFYFVNMQGCKGAPFQATKPTDKCSFNFK